MRDVMGVINIDSMDEPLEELTGTRCIASVPFGGRYRLVDFVLSSMSNSGVHNVGVFTLNKYRSLMDHLEDGKSWDLNKKEEGLFILPPNNYPLVNYRGDLHNFYDHLDYFYRSRQKQAIVSAGNIICNINFSGLVNFHRENSAHITIFYKELQGAGEFEHCRKLKTAKGGRVLQIEEEPGTMEDSDRVMIEIYLMEKALLVELIENSTGNGSCSLLRDGIIKNIGDLRVYGFPHHGYLSVINSVEQYYRHSMELLNTKIYEELFFKHGLVYTKVKDEPPVKYLEGASVSNSLLANGCLIEGDIQNSILFRGVNIHRGARVKDSIIMQKCEIGENAVIENAILDKESHVSGGRTVKGQKNNPVIIPKRKSV